ncbi:MAG: GNAT family N-acetyltransferase [Balneolaceae bacterium]|jgi:aminoglycoside 6'-N-acetyltransferase-1b/aminoglycoside 6'-N-acetyltransferase-2
MQFEFSPLREADLPILTDWLNRPHLQKWWRAGKITQDIVSKKYLPRIFNKDSAKPFLAYLENIPTGYIQYYAVSECESNWWPDKPGPGILGIDVFLANPNQLNRGIGTCMVSQFVDILFKDPKITEIRIDPHPDNLRAIRCYEKVGFKKVGLITNPDGPALMMTLDKKNFPRKT